MHTIPVLFRGSRPGLMIVVVCVLAACGKSGKGSTSTQSSSTVEPTSAPSTTTQGATTASTTTGQTSSSTAAAGCTPTPAVLAAAKKFSEVTTVSLIGGCGQISAATTLPPGALGSPSVTRALAVCTALTKVGYVGSVYGVTVVGKDGHELAASTKDQRQCI